MLEFIEKEHLYLYDGVIIPSVSEILKFIFHDKYKNIPDYILNNKADYGTKIHESVETLELYKKFIDIDISIKNTIQMKKLDYIQEASLKQYQRLCDEYNIMVLDQEQMIHFGNKYAGRFDMIARINNEECLCDIKTTAKLDKDYLSWQLSLYNYAYKNMYQKDFNKFYAIWLPKKEIGRLIEINKKTDEEINDLLERYFKNDK